MMMLGDVRKNPVVIKWERKKMVVKEEDETFLVF